MCVCACCGHAGGRATCVRVQVCLPGFDFRGRNSPKAAESFGMKLATSCKKTLRDGPGRGIEGTNTNCNTRESCLFWLQDYLTDVVKSREPYKTKKDYSKGVNDTCVQHPSAY